MYREDSIIHEAKNLLDKKKHDYGSAVPYLELWNMSGILGS